MPVGRGSSLPFEAARRRRVLSRALICILDLLHDLALSQLTLFYKIEHSIIMIEHDPMSESTTLHDEARADRVLFGIGAISIVGGLAEVWASSHVDVLPMPVRLVMFGQGILLSLFGALAVSYPLDHPRQGIDTQA